MPSPYESTLDLTGLHPRLQAYFGEIPAHSVGRGHGVFDVVGTPRRWLWPALWLLGRQGVVFPSWACSVPFTVTNSAAGAALTSIRTFHFANGDRSMRDRMVVVGGALVDELGTRRQYRARLVGHVVDGSMHLRSTSLRARVLWLPLPGAVEIIESWDDTAGQQSVSVTVSAPLIGRIYEYSGRFTYELEATDVSAP